MFTVAGHSVFLKAGLWFVVCGLEAGLQLQQSRSKTGRIDTPRDAEEQGGKLSVV